MGFIIDTIFGVADAVDDIKLNIQDMWYEKKLDHYINKYNNETGKYPESVVKSNNKKKPKMVSNYQPFVIPGTVYNGIPVPNNATPPVQVPEHAKKSVEVKTEIECKMKPKPMYRIPLIKSDLVTQSKKVEEYEKMVIGEVQKAIDEIKSTTEAKKDPPVKIVDPAEKEAPVEEAGAENYITIDALEGKTEHTETAKMQLVEQSKLDEVVKNMVEETLNASSKTETTTSKNKNTRTRKTK